MQSIVDFCAELLSEAQDELEGEHIGRGVPVSIWAGFADLGSPRGRDMLERLRDAGVERVVFTPCNDASRGVWSWQPARARIVRGVKAAKALGLSVVLGPWVRCSSTFMNTAGAALRELADEVGGVQGWELDAEGSWEVTARSRGRRRAGGVKGAVDEVMPYLTQHMLDSEELSATVLYFNRPAGDALLRYEGAGAGAKVVTSVVLQAYSIWLPGDSPKARATHERGFQPGTLQKRAWANYEKFKTERALERIEVGLGWWSQDRGNAPASLRLTEKDALRKASAACVELPCDGVCGWAAHLWDKTTGREARYLDMVCDEVRFLTGTPNLTGGAGVDVGGYPENPAGAVIDWESRWVDLSVAAGGRPKGYASVKGKGLSARVFGEVASVVRRQALEWGWVRGSCVPYVQGDKECVAVFQKHTATWRKGVLVRGLDIDGLTVFVKS